MRFEGSSRRNRLFATLGLASVVSVGMWLVGAINNHSLNYWYLNLNLFLAWLPIIFAGWLILSLRQRPWLSWRPLLLTVLWLGFLPNSFYLVTDFIHLQDVIRVNPLYYSIMFETFVVNGLLIGFLSLYLVHVQLLRRTSARAAASLIGLTLLICSFAVYLGRDLRLTSFDLVANPVSVLFSATDPFVRPASHIAAFTLTLAVFVFIGTFYFVAWQLLRNFHRPHEAQG